MPDQKSLIQEMYAAFNRRDIDATLAHMTDTIGWPKASEGGRVVGKTAVRDYWIRQWATFDPHVAPLEISPQADGRVRVKVHQLVKDLTGNILFDGQVWHTYTLAGGLIQRMDITGDLPWPDAQHP